MDPQITFDNLCLQCISLFEANPLQSVQFALGSTSHLTVAALKASCQGGCHFCCLILNSFPTEWKHDNDISEGGAGPPEGLQRAWVRINFTLLDRDESQVRLRIYVIGVPVHKDIGLRWNHSFSWLSEFDIAPLVS